ncbi:MAG: hypothetical protein WD075_05645 [Rhodospirillales bacterium]
MNEKNVYRVRLLRWGDSSASGRTVTLKLPDDDDEHPFKGLPVGSKNGQLLEMEIAIVDDDGALETLSLVKKTKPKIKPRLPVVAPEQPVENDLHRKRAVLTNVTRKVIKKTVPLPEPAPMLSPAPGPLPPPPLLQPRAEQPPPPQAVASTDSDAQPGAGSGNINSDHLDAYANQMSQAAEALAAVAERMDDHVEDDRPQFPTMPGDDDPDAAPGVRAVRRATDLCKAIDKQRAGFFYFMRSRYPEAPKMPGGESDWSRDAKSTRDRVCLHCESGGLDELAMDEEARRKFEELETEFERHERLR